MAISGVQTAHRLPPWLDRQRNLCLTKTIELCYLKTRYYIRESMSRMRAG